MSAALRVQLHGDGDRLDECRLPAAVLADEKRHLGIELEPLEPMQRRELVGVVGRFPGLRAQVVKADRVDERRCRSGRAHTTIMPPRYAARRWWARSSLLSPRRSSRVRSPASPFLAPTRCLR